MINKIFLFLLLMCQQYNTNAQESYTLPANAKRIVFLGNSITYAGQYVTFVEAALTIQYPNRKFEFINVGLPSETVSGLSETGRTGIGYPRPDLHERLARVLEQTKPDVVFACYGMNDGIYLPFDEARFQKFKEGIFWLHQQVVKSGAAIVHFTPPVYDERKGKAYANVLDIYSDWLLSCRYTVQWYVGDIHWPMKKYLEDRRLADSAFAYAKDGVHPNDVGHWVMAKQVLLFLGEKDLIKYEDPNAAFASIKNGERILKLVQTKQNFMKDAWLTAIGHKRLGMKTGLALTEAQAKAQEIDKQIHGLL